MIREAAVAGQFYPGWPEELKETIGYMTSREEAKIDAVGVISPHAGYIYSGPVAAYGYKLLQQCKFKKVIAIGPSHHAAFPGATEDDSDAWQTPLGNVITGRISKFAKPGIVNCFPQAHQPEHCLEVQLPI